VSSILAINNTLKAAKSVRFMILLHLSLAKLAFETNNPGNNIEAPDITSLQTFSEIEPNQIPAASARNGN
jgi:hypothetical protein